MAFSSRSTQTIEGFAASMDLPARPAADGSYSFVFSRSGRLTLTSSRDGGRVIVSLAKAPDRLNEDVERRVLDLAGPDQTTLRVLSAGVTRDGEVIMAVSIDEEEMGLPILETCLQQLIAAQSAVS